MGEARETDAARAAPRAGSWRRALGAGVSAELRHGSERRPLGARPHVLVPRSGKMAALGARQAGGRVTSSSES